MNTKKTIIITGANSGLGFVTAMNIAASNEYRIILACRNPQKANAARREIIEKTGNENIVAMQLDVSSLASVRAFAKEYSLSEYLPLYGLICNAGIMGAKVGFTEESFDGVFATNHLGHFLLSMRLLPFMKEDARIISVSSDMHCPPGPELVWPGAKNLVYPDQKLAASRMRYSYSKLCNLYFTYELSKRLLSINSTVTVNAFNPGLMTDTNFAPKMPRLAQAMMKKMVADRVGSLTTSSKALAELMTEPSFAKISGAYFDRSTKVSSSSPLSCVQQNMQDLWEISVEISKLTKYDTLDDLL